MFSRNEGRVVMRLVLRRANQRKERLKSGVALADADKSQLGQEPHAELALFQFYEH